MKHAILSALICISTPLSACDTALMLSIDVSNSIDVAEYRLQVDGMADALSDEDIVNTMVQGEVAIAIMQWSGAGHQELSIPWTRIRTRFDTVLLADRARDMERAFTLSDTAPAEAIYFALDAFDHAPQCDRKVIDISGDGTPNGGSDVNAARYIAQRDGVTINAIAIETMGLAISNFYRRTVVTEDGFVMTARTHQNYPSAIRAKILRELTKVLG
ncbi:VWA domain-containing protein [Loktanella sp. S4079]|uniref:VWA domain-containing protein n=1 Tax=Loktanella sp. S4079 TaxID=579483 RepID=UPI0005FA5847|nr:VWA domain-containing protein [Loktanella sp. S4079]KJZ20063.1 Von Willebrand factor type A domain protein [Loktanella sp. S4079]